MEEDIAIGAWGMLLAYLMLLPVLLLSMHYKLGIIKDTLWAVTRMSAQLLLVGFYLQYLFEWNSAVINFLWLFIMAAVACFTTLRQAKLPVKSCFAPAFAALLCSFLLVSGYFLLAVTGKNFCDARLFIPIGGMLLGNSMRSNVVVIERFARQLRENHEEYCLRLMLGATRTEAVAPFAATALKSGVAPMIAMVATMGIVSLPGMMTGQLLGGSPPGTAIKYQIAIMLGVFCVQMCSSGLLLHFLRGKIINMADENIR